MGNNTMPKCSCKSCNALGVYKLPVRKRGGGNAFLCEFHWNYNDPYSADNLVWIGENKAHGDTASIELETSRTTKNARLELCVNSFRPTHDCTVDTEYKSPCYNGFNALKAYLSSIQDMIDSNDLEINQTCGTHLHLGNRYHINHKNMEAIRRFYHSLFVPLSDAMKNDSAKTARIFGRDFGEWAKPIYDGINPVEHTNFINTQHDETLEFRICKFVTAEQYSAAVDLCREFLHIIIRFLEKYESMGSPRRGDTTPEQRAELVKAAKKAARQMVKAFEKA